MKADIGLDPGGGGVGRGGGGSTTLSVVEMAPFKGVQEF